jgi:tRNA (adenine22-N1)-methyltransferase
MALSRRLNQIDRMVNKHYSHIWDCCCDHGLLGMKLLERSAADALHFVDVVEPLMCELEAQLKKYAAPTDNWQVHCLDVAQLPIAQTPVKDSHLVIIAGVGGDLMIELVTKILANNPSRVIEFLLCPVYQQYKLRLALIKLELNLEAEYLLRDNKQFYEIIHVTVNNAPAGSEQLSPVGSLMWDFSQAEHRDYRLRMIEHYQRIMHNNPKAAAIVKQYQALR